MRACAPLHHALPWAAHTLRDSEQQRWLRLDLALLAQSERFLDAGFGGLPLHKDIG